NCAAREHLKFQTRRIPELLSTPRVVGDHAAACGSISEVCHDFNLYGPRAGYRYSSDGRRQRRPARDRAHRVRRHLYFVGTRKNNGFTLHGGGNRLERPSDAAGAGDRHRRVRTRWWPADRARMADAMGSLALAVFTLVAAYFFHDFWHIPVGTERADA